MKTGLHFWIRDPFTQPTQPLLWIFDAADIFHDQQQKQQQRLGAAGMSRKNHGPLIVTSGVEEAGAITSPVRICQIDGEQRVRKCKFRGIMKQNTRLKK